jgi:methyltransferase (TIGR00027 family)
MDESRSSKTAEYMALFRAIETCRRPLNVRLFDDILAIYFLETYLKKVVILSRIPILGKVLTWYIDRKWPGARTSGVARTRLIDDRLCEALREGFGQIVILGSGYDCRAYRIPGIEKARIFEVDHPATLARKKEIINCSIGCLPDHVVYVDIDFNRQSLSRVMRSAGFDSGARTFFIWEGVTNYLSEDAVDSTLRYIGAETARGSRIIFTYIHIGVLDGSKTFKGVDELWRTLEHAGEVWTFGIDPEHIRTYLEERGLDLIEDIGSEKYRMRYMGSSGKHLKGYEFYRAAIAELRH